MHLSRNNFPANRCKTPQQDRYSGFRIGLLTAPSLPVGKVAFAVFVPGYSSATATDSHRLPCVCLGPMASRPSMVQSIRAPSDVCQRMEQDNRIKIQRHPPGEGAAASQFVASLP